MKNWLYKIDLSAGVKYTSDTKYLVLSYLLSVLAKHVTNCVTSIRILISFPFKTRAVIHLINVLLPIVCILCYRSGIFSLRVDIVKPRHEC
jgi:hypothetical protein